MSKAGPNLQPQPLQHVLDAASDEAHPIHHRGLAQAVVTPPRVLRGVTSAQCLLCSWV